jgi:protein-L-isoaspartate(D-aspartate) O-methyltransferase
MTDLINNISGIGMTSARTRNRLVSRLKDQGITSNEVLEQILNVPRHLFVDEALSTRAYEDTALPIGMGQTISQPYIVAKMTESLFQNNKRNKILEIGTGCGYQTAILSSFYKKIYSVERIPEILRKTKKRLHNLNIYNVNFRLGDGWEGWSKYAPYDGIIVSAAANEVPKNLLKQLIDGGVLVIPIGATGKQELQLIEKNDKIFKYRSLGYVSFVPLVKGHQ